jgi:predicted MPP superfamily phosphohydrolase
MEEPKINLENPEITRRELLKIFGTLGLGLALPASVYAVQFTRNGTREAQQPIGIHRLNIRHRLIPPEFDGRKIFQLADPHFSNNTYLGQKLRRESDAQRIKEIIEVEYSPNDLFVFLGDSIPEQVTKDENDLVELGKACAIFQGLNLTKIFTLGNHEYAVGKSVRSAILEIIQGTGFTILRDERIAWEVGNSKLPVFGTEDWQFGNPSLERMRAWRKEFRNEFGIILTHNADWLETTPRLIEELKIALVLSGHTHGGMIEKEILARLALLTIHYQSEHFRGVKNYGDLTHNISNGAGHEFPLRDEVPPEISVITLHSAA